MLTCVVVLVTPSMSAREENSGEAVYRWKERERERDGHRDHSVAHDDRCAVRVTDSQSASLVTRSLSSADCLLRSCLSLFTDPQLCLFLSLSLSASLN